MRTPLITTKLYIPPPSLDLVPRPRLIERLDHGLRGKLTLISAPAGFGKTTLVSEWIFRNDEDRMVKDELHPSNVAWLSLEDADNELNRFLTYCVTALQTIEENIGAGVLSLLQAPQPPPTQTILTTLINEIAVLSDNIVLVLDDYHRISEKTIHEALIFLLDHLPPNLHLVLIGRVDPPLSLSRLRVQGQINEIRTNDLRFTIEEAAAFLNDRMDLDLAPEDVSALENRTEGWIASLQLAALSLQGRHDKSEFVAAFSGSHHYVLDYLVDEVMSRQPEDVQSFLKRTSILDRFCAPLCDGILEISNSQHILGQLERANLFLIHLDEERRWFRYHHLFADFLYQHLIEEDSKIIPQLHSRASSWFEENSLIPEAINHSLQADDYDVAAKLVESIGPDMMMQSRFDQLSKWLEAMPDEVVNTWPWLCIIQAWMCQRWARLDQAEQYLQFAEQALELEAAPEPMGGENIIRGQISAIRALFSLTQVQISQAIEYANQALDFLPVGHFNRPVASDVLGMAMRITGEFDESIRILDDARGDSLAVGNLILAQAIVLELGLTYMLQGRLYRAAETFREAIGYNYPETQIKIPYASASSVYLAHILREWNKLDEAMTHLEVGINIGLPAQMVDAVGQGYAIQARVHLAQGDVTAAQAAYQRANKIIKVIPNPENESVTFALNTRIRLLIAQDNLLEAESVLLDRNLKISHEIKHFVEIEHISLARVLTYKGRDNPAADYLADAQTIITRILKIMEPVGSMREVIELQVLQAMAYEAQGLEDRALESLEKALTLAEPERYVRTFIDEGAPMIGLLRQAVSRGITKDYAGRLLSEFEPRSVKKPPLTQPLVEPLTERELEVLKLLATDLTGPEIANELMVSLNTMRTHTKNIYSKLGVTNRRAAVSKAMDLNLL